MNDLLETLNNTLTEMVEAKLDEKLQAVSFESEAESAVEEAAREHNYDDAIERAVEGYNFDGPIGEALRNYDLSEDAEKAVQEAVENFEFDELIGEKIDAVLDQKLPSAIEKHFLALLEKPEFAEKLVTLLFDRATT